MTKTSFFSTVCILLALSFLLSCGSSVREGSFSPDRDTWSLSRSEISIVGMEKKIEVKSNGEIVYTEKLESFEIDREELGEMTVSELKNLQAILLSFDIFNQTDLGDVNNDSLSTEQFTYTIISDAQGSNYFVIAFEDIEELPFEIQKLQMMMDELIDKLD